MVDQLADCFFKCTRGLEVVAAGLYRSLSLNDFMWLKVAASCFNTD